MKSFAAASTKSKTFHCSATCHTQSWPSTSITPPQVRTLELSLHMLHFSSQFSIKTPIFPIETMRIKWPRTSYEARQLKKQNHRRLMDMLEVRGPEFSRGRCFMVIATRAYPPFRIHRDRTSISGIPSTFESWFSAWLEPWLRFSIQASGP